MRFLVALLLWAASGVASAQRFEALPCTDLERAGEQLLACNARGVWRQVGEEWQLCARTAFRALRCARAADGALYVVGGEPAVSGILARFDAEGALQEQLVLATDFIYDVDLDARGEQLALACADGRVLLLALEDGRCGAQRELHRHAAAARAVRFAPSGELLASAGLDAQVLVRELRSDAVPRAIGDHLAGVECLAFSPDGERLASGARDGRVRVHDREGRLLRICEPAGAPILALCWPSAAVFVAGTSRGGVLRARWSMPSWEALEAPNERPVRALLAVEPEGVLHVGALVAARSR
jgi:hypothetical protein